MARPLALLLATVVVVVGSAGPVRAVTYFQKSWTGAELAVDPAVVFPNIVPSSLDGATLLWGTVPNNTVPPGSQGPAFAKLFELPLVSAGVLAPDAPIRITLDYQFQYNATPLFGPVMTLYVPPVSPSPFNRYWGPGLQVRPNGNPTVVGWGQEFLEDAFAPTDIVAYSDREYDRGFDLPSAAPNLLSGQFLWDFEGNLFRASMPANDETVFWKDDQVVSLAGSSVDLSRALSFTFWLQPADDSSGGITSLSLRVEAVPEPTSVALLVIGALSGAVLGRHRR